MGNQNEPMGDKGLLMEKAKDVIDKLKSTINKVLAGDPYISRH